jgi:hypothetical protein
MAQSSHAGKFAPAMFTTGSHAISVSMTRGMIIRTADLLRMII